MNSFARDLAIAMLDAVVISKSDVIRSKYGLL